MNGAKKSLRSLLQRKKLDAILFSSLENIRFLCGFTGSDGSTARKREFSFPIPATKNRPRGRCGERSSSDTKKRMKESPRASVL